MKIGIYGDSYASANSPSAVKWYELLAKKLENVPTTTIKRKWWQLAPSVETPKQENTLSIYSLAGSSLFYTYQQFVSTCQNQDLNIVMVTGPGRYTKKLKLPSVQTEMVVTGEAHLDSVLEMFATRLSPSDRNRVAYLRGWFKSVDDDFCNTAADLMIDKMKSIHSNTIFYPCFSDSFSIERFKQEGLRQQLHHAHQMWHRQLELLGKDANTFGEQESENMCGHTGPEFNEYFADVLYKKITTGNWDHSKFFDVTLTHPYNYYYKT